MAWLTILILGIAVRGEALAVPVVAQDGGGNGQHPFPQARDDRKPGVHGGEETIEEDNKRTPDASAILSREEAVLDRGIRLVRKLHVKQVVLGLVRSVWRSMECIVSHARPQAHGYSPLLSLLVRDITTLYCVSWSESQLEKQRRKRPKPDLGLGEKGKCHSVQKYTLDDSAS